jgi:hypothetical protein
LENPADFRHRRPRKWRPRKNFADFSPPAGEDPTALVAAGASSWIDRGESTRTWEYSRCFDGLHRSRRSLAATRNCSSFQTTIAPRKCRGDSMTATHRTRLTPNGGSWSKRRIANCSWVVGQDRGRRPLQHRVQRTPLTDLRLNRLQPQGIRLFRRRPRLSRSRSPPFPDITGATQRI